MRSAYWSAGLPGGGLELVFPEGPSTCVDAADNAGAVVGDEGFQASEGFGDSAVSVDGFRDVVFHGAFGVVHLPLKEVQDTLAATVFRKIRAGKGDGGDSVSRFIVGFRNRLLHSAGQKFRAHVPTEGFFSVSEGAVDAATAIDHADTVPLTEERRNGIRVGDVVSELLVVV